VRQEVFLSLRKVPRDSEKLWPSLTFQLIKCPQSLRGFIRLIFDGLNCSPPFMTLLSKYNFCKKKPFTTLLDNLIYIKILNL
jgi:hypothetical protein